MPDPVPPTEADDSPPETADLSGRQLGGFHVIRRLGAGGMGQVYLAKQVSLQRLVALKLLRSELTRNTTALKRFEAEAQAVAKLNHPNIVQVYESGEHNGLRYMALEYVEGRNLREHLVRKGPPDLPVALSIMRQVATALQKAHDQGIVHRDIKPENILVTRKVEVKVTDFGLSRFFAGGEALNLTQSGVALGTPLYLSPEQAQGHAVDHRSDIYSFGVTCYHLLAGEPPFRGTTAVEVALKHITDQASPLGELRPDLPPDLCAIIHKMMAKSVDDRYGSAREVLRDLTRVKEGLNLGTTQMVGPNGLGTEAMTAQLRLSGGGAHEEAFAVATAHTSVRGGAVQPAPVRWGRWALAGALVLLAGVGGAVGYVGLHPQGDSHATTPPSPPATVVGLPEVHVIGRVWTTRERELLALLADPKAADHSRVDWGIELGLLLLREGRLDEARDRFELIEKTWAEKPGAFAGRLGRAVVMAYREDPQAPQMSLNQFTEAVTSALPMPGKLPKGEKLDRAQMIRAFLLRHPNLAQAVAEALNRDAVNLGLPKLPGPLESMRTARGLMRAD